MRHFDIHHTYTELTSIHETDWEVRSIWNLCTITSIKLPLRIEILTGYILAFCTGTLERSNLFCVQNTIFQKSAILSLGCKKKKFYPEIHY
jgi:hypothetical protein